MQDIGLTRGRSDLSNAGGKSLLPTSLTNDIGAATDRRHCRGGHAGGLRVHYN